MEDGEAPRWTDETGETNATREKSQATQGQGVAGVCTERSGVFYRALDGIKRQRLGGARPGASVACMGAWDALMH